MYILHEGKLLDSLDLQDPELADLDVQVVAWLTDLLKPSTCGTDADVGPMHRWEG